MQNIFKECLYKCYTLYNICITLELWLWNCEKFQLNVCKRCRDLLMSMNLSSIAILNIKGFDYCFIISLISKNGPINLLQNNDIGKNRGTFKIEKSIKKI